MQDMNNMIERKYRYSLLGKWASAGDLSALGISIGLANAKTIEALGVDIREREENAGESLLNAKNGEDEKVGVIALKDGKAMPLALNVRTENINGVQLFNTSDLKHYGILTE